MRWVSWSRVGIAGFVLLLVVHPSLAASLNKRARLREGASRDTTLVGWIESGTKVDILGQKSGWYQVLLADGRRGFVWGEHLDEVDTTPAGAGEGVSGRPEASTLRDELRALRSQLAELKSGELFARRQDVEALSKQVEQLGATQRDFLETLDGSAAGVATPLDGTAVAAGAFLTVGGILGWIAARMTNGRRDRRGRIRI